LTAKILTHGLRSKNADACGVFNVRYGAIADATLRFLLPDRNLHLMTPL
jgi:hypothetical protein